MLDRLQGKLFNGLMRGDLRGLRDLAWHRETHSVDMLQRLAERGFIVNRGDTWPHITMKGYFALLVRRIAGR